LRWRRLHQKNRFAAIIEFLLGSVTWGLAKVNRVPALAEPLYAAWGDKVGQKKIGVLTKAKQSRSISVRCAAMAANFAKLPGLLRRKAGRL